MALLKSNTSVQDVRPGFKIAPVNATAVGQRMVFEVGVHSNVLQAACQDDPAGTRALLVEHACRHVERTSNLSLCRHRRNLKVLSRVLTLCVGSALESSVPAASRCNVVVLRETQSV